MKDNLNFTLIFLFTTFLFNSCKEEPIEHPNPKFGPTVLTPYHISAYVDSNFVDAAYGPEDPDTISSIYSISPNYFTIQRFVSDTSPEGWVIIGGNNLNQVTYPLTIWPSKSPFNGMFVSYQKKNGEGRTTNSYDSTLFSITLLRFDHDTLFGTFQGKLFCPPNYNCSDSVMNVTQGIFKILLNKVS